MRIVPVAIAASAIMLAAGAVGLNAASVPKLNRAQAARVMHARHEGMETIGKSFKALHRELDASSPNLATVRAASATVAKLALQSNAWFPAGTGPEVGKTGAKPDIWVPANKADFALKQHNFLVATTAFNAATAGTDLTAIKARYGELGGTCKACHDKYRSEMHH